MDSLDPLPPPAGLSHQLGSARLAVASFVQSALCRSALARLAPSHARPYEGQTLSVALAAQAELRAALAEIEALALAARAAAPPPGAPAGAPRSRARISPPLGSPLDRQPPPSAAGLAQLDAILARFSASRDAILSIHHASQSLAESLGMLDAHARAAWDASPPDLDLDPLGAGPRLALFAQGLLAPPPAAPPALAHSNQALLADARASLGALRALRARRLLADEQCKSAIDAGDLPPSQAPPPDAIAFLERWLDKLRQVSQAGQHAAAAVGLSKLAQSLAEQERAEALELDRARAPLDELADLRGRFDAFKAKARALASAGRPLSQRAQALQEACRSAMDARPARLASLRKAQRAFESCVSDLGS